MNLILAALTGCIGVGAVLFAAFTPGNIVAFVLFVFIAAYAAREWVLMQREAREEKR